MGKSTALRVLLEVLEKLDGIKGEMYVIDPKAISKEVLYGSLDGTTLEWTDGVFTSILRRVIDNQKGESEKRHWIVFDGDVDVSYGREKICNFKFCCSNIFHFNDSFLNSRNGQKI